MASWAVVKDADLDGTEWPLFAWLHPSDQSHTAPGVERMNGSNACTSISLSLLSRLERDETLPVWSDLEDILERGVRRHVRMCSELSKSKPLPITACAAGCPLILCNI